MSNTNLVIVTGNLGQDPVVEESNGTRYGRFGLANNERFRSKATGTVEAHTNWFSIVAFGDLTNSLLRLATGDKVTVIGRLRTGTRTRAPRTPGSDRRRDQREDGKNDYREGHSHGAAQAVPPRHPSIEEILRS